MADRRIVCVWMPCFRSAVEARERPELAGRTIAIFQPIGRSRELVECPPELMEEGMRPGMPLKEAESRWPEVAFVPEDPPRYAQALRPVLEVLDSFSPTVEVGSLLETDRYGPGVIFLDGTGLEPLYGPEERLGQLIVRDLAEMTEYQARVGIAGSKFAAVVGAMLGHDHERVRVVPTGGDAAFLASLPIGLLPLPEDARERASRLGLRTLGEFARLPANALRHRFGADGARVRALVLGQDDEPLRPRPMPLQVHDVLDLEWVETDLDRLTFILKRLADRLSARLARHGLGSGRLHVVWRLEDGEQVEASVRLAERSSGGRRLLEHLRWHVEGLRLEAGVCGIAVEAEELGPLPGYQLRLLAGEEGRPPRHERLLKARDVLTRLAARWGEEAVRQAEPVVSRRPERAFQWRAFDPLAAQGVTTDRRRAGQRVRLVRSAKRPKPRPRDVECGEGIPPLWLCSEPKDLDVRRSHRGARIRRRGRFSRVVRSGGPWRLVEPWGPEPVARDAYQAETTDGAVCWLIYDHLAGRWRLLGTFD